MSKGWGGAKPIHDNMVTPDTALHIYCQFYKRSQFHMQLTKSLTVSRQVVCSPSCKRSLRNTVLKDLQ